MKTRRLTAPLTQEDFEIWDRLSEPFGSQRFEDGVPLWGYQEAHLHEADLMNWAQTIRRVRADGCRMLKPLNDRVSSADPNPIDYGGDITRFV